jgi:hypothetical protein
VSFVAIPGYFASHVPRRRSFSGVKLGGDWFEEDDEFAAARLDPGRDLCWLVAIFHVPRHDFYAPPAAFRRAQRRQSAPIAKRPHSRNRDPGDPGWSCHLPCEQ